jgi:hypothetical protein
MHPDNRMVDDDRPSTEDVLTATDQAAGTERVDEPEPAGAMPTDDGMATVELFQAGEVDRFRVEWHEIQARFVDDPRDAVKSADHLVAEVMRALATTFTDHKHELEGHWQQGNRVETEDLRNALRRYRSFFNQLLSV